MDEVVVSADLTPEQVAAIKAEWERLMVRLRPRPPMEWSCTVPVSSPFVTLEPRVTLDIEAEPGWKWTVGEDGIRLMPDEPDEPHVVEGPG
jgi:hypothetical protein